MSLRPGRPRGSTGYPRPIKVPRRCGIVTSRRDSDLEAFSHSPADGSFAPVATQPSTRTKSPHPERGATDTDGGARKMPREGRRGAWRRTPETGTGGGAAGRPLPQPRLGPASQLSPTDPALKANPYPEVTDLTCRLPLRN